MRESVRLNTAARPPIPAPNKVWISITNACNVNCKHCLPNSRLRMPGELSTAELLDLITQCAELGVKRVAFTGGEPTLRKDLIDLVAKAAQYKMRVYVETSGSLMTRERLVALKEAGLSILNLSLDGATAAVHDEFRGVKGLYQKVLTTIRHAVELGLDVRVYCTVTQENYGEARQLPELFANMGLPGKLGVLTFAYFVPVGRGAINAQLSVPAQKWREFCDYIEGQRAHFEPIIGPIRYEPAFLRLDEMVRYRECLPYDFTCIARDRDYLYINPIGDVYGCVLLTGTAMALGNIRQQPLFDIWYSSTGWSFFHRQPETTPPTSCSGGGCPALAFLHNGNATDPDPRWVEAGSEFIPICPLTQFPMIEPWEYEKRNRS